VILTELKDYVKETLRTGSAQEIRENIKYLNEKRQKPTQEKLLVLLTLKGLKITKMKE
jgi:hypothetical protein